MTINEIIESSQYLTDNILDSTDALPLLKNCIAIINSRLGTNLPFFAEINLTEEYDAFGTSYMVSLFEPFLSYSIAANDENQNVMMHHYGRFMDALNNFKTTGLSTIKATDGAGNDTGYAGKSKRAVKIDGTKRTVHFYGNNW